MMMYGVGVDKKIDRILKNTDSLMNKYFSYNEINLVPLAKRYIMNYLDNVGCVVFGRLVVLCNVCYLLAVKFLLDEYPRLVDYSNIVCISKDDLIDSEYTIAVNLNFNFNVDI